MLGPLSASEWSIVENGGAHAPPVGLKQWYAIPEGPRLIPVYYMVKSVQIGMRSLRAGVGSNSHVNALQNVQLEGDFPYFFNVI